MDAEIVLSQDMAEYYWQVIHDYPEEFKLGITEATLSTGVTFDGDPSSARSIAYDLGRTFGEGIARLYEETYVMLNTEYCSHGPSVYDSYCPKCTEESND
jgi:hypothetical protein